MRYFWLFLHWITLGDWRAARTKIRRRANYEFLKAAISARHFGGFRGLIVDFPGKKFDKVDLASFRQPMYFLVMNQDRKWCIFWDSAKLAQEIGVGAPLQPGEVLVENRGPMKPEATADQIDEKAPLTRQEAKPSEPQESA